MWLGAGRSLFAPPEWVFVSYFENDIWGKIRGFCLEDIKFVLEI